MIENPNVKIILELVHAISGVLLEKDGVSRTNSESTEGQPNPVLESKCDTHTITPRVRTVQQNQPK